MGIDKNLLVGIIQARVEGILHIRKRTVMNSGFYDEISGVVVVGGGISLFRGASELSKVILDKSVRIGSPEYVGAASPIYVTAVGIVVQAVNDLKTTNSSAEDSDEHNWSEN